MAALEDAQERIKPRVDAASAEYYSSARILQDSFAGAIAYAMA